MLLDVNLINFYILRFFDVTETAKFTFFFMQFCTLISPMTHDRIMLLHSKNKFQSVDICRGNKTKYSPLHHHHHHNHHLSLGKRIFINFH